MKKRILGAVLAVVLLASMAITSAAAISVQPGGVVRIYGDVDLNSTITVDDVTTIQRYLAGYITLSSTAKKNADVNADGVIDINDATYIQMYLAGMTHNSRTGQIWIEY